MPGLRFRFIGRFPGDYIVAGAGVWLAILLLSSGSLPLRGGDGEWYVALARARPYQVGKPFSTRVLHPYFAASLASIGGINIDQAFLWIAVFSLLVCTISASYFITRTTHSPPLAFALLMSPLLYEYFTRCYLQDLFHAAILALFFVALAHERLMIALALLFAAVLTRESTLVLSAVLMVWALVGRRKALVLGAGLVSAAGLLVTSIAGGFGQGNIHGIHQLLYLVLKVPFNFLKNVAGVVLWSNTHAAYMPGYPSPVFVYPLPDWLWFGSVRAIGLCPFDPSYPITTALLLLTEFGILPAAAALVLVRSRGRLFAGQPWWMKVAFTYGALAFLAGPCIGAVYRLAGYGWPAFWLAAPALFFRNWSNEARTLLACHVVLVLAGNSGWWDGLPVRAIILLAVMCIHYLALRPLNRALTRPSLPAQASGVAVGNRPCVGF